jgi:hypothetical protein
MKCRHASLLFAAVLPAVTGCQSMVAPCAPPPQPAVRKAQPIAKIDVRSIPTGCVVELNDEYLGVTPLEVVVDATESGNWASQGFGSVFVMKCSRPDGDGWEQKVWYPGDRIPSRVLFPIPGAMKRLAVN